MRLVKKLEAADAGSRRLDAEIAVAFGYERDGDEFWLGDESYSIAEPDYYASAGQCRELPAFSTSIDAALTLLPDGCFWAITMRGEKRGGYHACCQISGDLDWREGSTPALALCAAICRAKGI